LLYPGGCLYDSAPRQLEPKKGRRAERMRRSINNNRRKHSGKKKLEPSRPHDGPSHEVVAFTLDLGCQRPLLDRPTIQSPISTHRLQAYSSASIIPSLCRAEVIFRLGMPRSPLQGM